MTIKTPEMQCATCKKTKDELPNPLKVCARCKIVQYCSRDCQRADWKPHKTVCATISSAETPVTTPPDPRFKIERPFTALRDGNWLSSRPEQDVYQLMSDVFRMRRDDQYKFEGEVEDGSVYAGGSASSELQNYRRFLKKVTELDEARTADKKLLPVWWSPEKLEECVNVARTNADAMVATPIEKSDIQEFYGQFDMPMQLRMFGEALDGTKVMGQSGSTMLQMRAAAESGQSGMVCSHMEVKQA